ncbi:uncharacterized protein LOC132279816 [Cornus florida]|uniref:uncharacterized protein LOC132279816 n=1 Tax=Cornus florida TaxID=4283 RepID=UPI0028A0692E|nr:uncharacterized protein LOC132279816 [Cornus florida]
MLSEKSSDDHVTTNHSDSSSLSAREKKSPVTADEKKNSMADKVKEIVDTTDLHLDVLVDLHPTVSPNPFGLGRAFENIPPSSLSEFYPLPEKKLPFSQKFEAEDSKGPFFYIRSWHIPNQDWIDWVDRVEAEKGDLWKELDIYDAIMFSKVKVSIDKPLLFSSLFFWSVSTNAFHFRCGMMSPTIQDVCFLTGLRPHGEEIHPLLFNPHIAYDYPTKDAATGTRHISSYSHFLSVCKGTGPVTLTEHIAFLIYWLNKCMFRGPAGAITKDFTQVAIALASGQKLALAPLVLSHLYRAIHDFIAVNFATGAGPLWLLQFWLQAYFPELGPQINPYADVPLYGYHYLAAQPKSQSFAACFCYFYDQAIYRSPMQFIPFLPRTKGPKWLLYGPGEAPPADAEEHHAVWSSFLIGRDLHYSPARLGSANCKCGVEYYNAAQLARQFGLTQLVPLPPYPSCNKVFSIRSFISSDAQIKNTSNLFQDFKTDFQVKRFEEMPNSTSAFDIWWTKYIITTRVEDAGTVLMRISAYFGSLEPNKSVINSKKNDGSVPTVVRIKKRKPPTRKSKAALPPTQPILSAHEEEKEEEDALACPTYKKVRKLKTSATFPRGKRAPQISKEKEKRKKRKVERKNNDEVLHMEAQPKGSSQEVTLAAVADIGIPVADISSTLAFPSISSTIAAMVRTAAESTETKSPTWVNKEICSATTSSSPGNQGSMEELDAFFRSIESSVDADEEVGEVTVVATPPLTGPSEEDIEKAKSFLMSTVSKDLSELPNITAELTNALSVLTSIFVFTTEQFAALVTLQKQLPTILAEYHSFTKTSQDCDSKLQLKKSLGDQLKANVAMYKQSKETRARFTQRETEIEKEIARLQLEHSSIRKENEEIGYKLKDLQKETIELNKHRSQIIAEAPRLEAEKKKAEEGVARTEQIWTELRSKFVNIM